MKYLWLAVCALLAGSCGLVSPSVEGPSALPAFRHFPTRISVPSIGAESSLIQVSLNRDGTMEVPDVHAPMQGAWYRGTDKTPAPAPGETGPSLILAHVNGGGAPGLFAHLAEIKKGSEVRVTLDDSRVVTFLIYEVQSVDKSSFPTSKVYGPTPGAEIRLVTCGGVFDSLTRSYRNNVIAYGALKS